MRLTWVATAWLLAGCGDDGGSDDGTSGSTDAAPHTTTDGSSTTTSPADETASTGAPVEPGECEVSIPAHEPATARLSIVDGRLVDELGRHVTMRGLNTGGRSKFAPFLPFDVTDPADLDEVRAQAEVYFDRMVGWGLDTARMPFSWEALEPSPGRYDTAYLARYEVLLDAAWARRLRVIVDFHQDVYASPFCGDGFPPWSVPTADPPPPTHDCPDWFLGYFANADVRESFDRFWSDVDGLQGPFLDMWLTMIDAVGGHPAVVGVEPMNEPGWGTMDDIDAFKTDVLGPWHTQIAAQLRAAAPDALVFYDGPGADSTGAPSHFRPDGDGLVYAPHLYDATLLIGDEWGGVSPGPALGSMAAFGEEAGVPVLLGEFGFTHGATGGDQWLTLVVDALDDHRISATLWEYSTSTELWNGEDLSVTEADGSERPILDSYVRPWVRALSGTGLGTQWDGAARSFTASFTAGPEPTEIVVPARVFAEGPQTIELSGDGACHTWDPTRTELRVLAPEGTAVSVIVR